MTTITLDLMVTCALYGIGIGIMVFIVGCVPKKSRLTAEGNEWLFEHFFMKLYVAFFGPDVDPVKVSKSLGLKYDEYMLDNAVIGRTPDFEVETMKRIVGTFAFFFSLPVSIILFSPIPMVFGIILYLLLVSYPVRSVHAAAEHKKQRMAAEMSRFVDLFLAALEINLPIETAIIQTAESVPCLLSDELKETFAETKIGAKNWQQALEAIAQKYEVDQLSDFVLNVITAFNKGVSVTDAVSRESYAVRQNALLAAKERTAKMTSGILFPLLVFKILPLLVILMVPIMMQAMSFYGA